MRQKLLFLVSLTLGACAGLGGDKANEIAIVVNKASVLDNVSKADLVRYMKVQKTKTPDGTKLVLVMQDEGRPERVAMLEKVYAMSDSELGRYFLQATFTGAIAAAPKSLPDGAGVIKFVAANPGGIGYVRASEADDSVKIVKVDGKAPGEDGYPITIK